MNSKEAIEQVKKSHFIAMSMLTEGKRDEKTEEAISVIEKDLELLEVLKRCFRINGFDELIPNSEWFDLPFEDRNKIYKLYEELENDKKM